MNEELKKSLAKIEAMLYVVLENQAATTHKIDTTAFRDIWTAYDKRITNFKEEILEHLNLKKPDKL